MQPNCYHSFNSEKSHKNHGYDEKTKVNKFKKESKRSFNKNYKIFMIKMKVHTHQKCKEIPYSWIDRINIIKILIIFKQPNDSVHKIPMS